MGKNEKWIDTFIRALRDISDPKERSKIYIILTGVITEFKKGTYKDRDSIDVLNSFGIQSRHIGKEKEKEI